MRPLNDLQQHPLRGSSTETGYGIDLVCVSVLANNTRSGVPVLRLLFDEVELLDVTGPTTPAQGFQY